MDHQSEQTFVSVVVPLLNESATLEALYRRLSTTLQDAGFRFEIIFVDDGSTDDSAKTLRALAKADQRVRWLRMRANFGKSAALAAGIRAANGNIVATIDADLQERPEEITLLLAKLAEGYDVVSGWRVQRGDGSVRSGSSSLYNSALRLLTGIGLHDFNCGFKCYRRTVFDEVTVRGERHRYLPVLTRARGFRVAEVPVAHGPRMYGRSRYGWGRIIDGLLGILAAMTAGRFARKPGSFFAYLALTTIAVGIVLFVLPIVMLPLAPHWIAALVALAVLFAAAATMVTIALVLDLLASITSPDPEYALAETSDDTAYVETRETSGSEAAPAEILNRED